MGQKRGRKGQKGEGWGAKVQAEEKGSKEKAAAQTLQAMVEKEVKGRRVLNSS